MALFAARGTSLLMTILIWFLGLLGINIGGKDDPIQQNKEYYFIPEGASLEMKDKTLQGPDKLDKDIKLEDGTVYTYGDYAYTKDTNCWKAKVIDKTKTSYESVSLKTQIVDKDLNVLRTEKKLFGVDKYKLSYCYRDCVNLVDAPNVPNGCLDMTGAFQNCEKLVTPPQIEGAPDMSYAFEGCPYVNFPNGYKISFPGFYMNFETKTHSWKFIQQKFSEDDVARILDKLERLDYKYCGKDIKAGEIKFYDEHQNTLTLRPVPSDPHSAYFTIQYRNDTQYASANDDWFAKGSKCCGDYEVKTKLVKICDDKDNYCCTLELIPTSDSAGPEHYIILEQSSVTNRLDGIVGYLWDYFDVKGYKFAGTRINISGFTIQADDINYSFVQPNTNTLKGSYWDAEPTKDWKNDTAFAEDSFVRYINRYALRNSFGGYPIYINGYTVTTEGIRFRFVQPETQTLNGSYWLAEPTQGYTESFLSRILNGYNGVYTEYPICINGFTTNWIEGVDLTLVQAEAQAPNEGYWAVSITDSKAVRNVTWLIRNTLTDKDARQFYGIPISFNGVSDIITSGNNKLTLTFVQKNGRTLEDAYWTTSGISECSQDFFCYAVFDNLKGTYCGYPIYVNGFTTDDGGYVRFRFVQPDTKTFIGSYWVAEPMDDCKDDDFLDIVLSIYSTNKFCNYPVYINGFTTNDGYVRFRFVQPDTQTFTGSYWVAEPLSNRVEDDFLDIIFNIYGGYLADYPIYINDFTTNDGSVRFRFVQPDTQTLAGSYWIATPMGDLSDEEFLRIISDSEFYGGYLEGYPIKTEPTLA